jgi:hypothetical protein
MSYVTLSTDVKNFQKATFTASSATAPNRIVTTTKPTGSNSAVFGASLNYLKLKIYSSGTAAPTIYVFGWSFRGETMTYVPQLLCTFSTTLNASSQSLEGATVYEAASFTQVTGDCKIYSGVAGTGNGGFVMLDTVGCHSVEVYAVDGAGNTITVLSSGL